MLEHGTVYLSPTYYPTPTGREASISMDEIPGKYIKNRFSRVNITDGKAYITTNLRVLAENGWLDDLQYFCEPTEHHEKRVTVHFTTQIAITREFNRHRADSMAEQSTRYCNYSRAKFGNEITINLPTWVHQEMMNDDSDWTSQINGGLLTVSGHQFLDLSRKVVDGSATPIENWIFSNLAAEKSYMNLVAAGRKPQEARVVLPLDTATELVHTAFVSDWKHFFDLRALGTTGAPHPDAKALAMPLYEQFKQMNLI